jgi:L-asparagine oxygenase
MVSRDALPMLLTAPDRIKSTSSTALIDLDERERRAILVLAREVASAAASAPDSLARLTAGAAESLPSKLLELAEQVTKTPPEYSGWLLRGLPIAQDRLGPTPRSWRRCAEQPTPEDCQLLLIGQVFGAVFAWADQQGGAAVHNIVPVVGEEDSLLSSSSTTALTLHTEDAYFTERADLLLLLCLRNPSHVATYIADVRDVMLSEENARLVRGSEYFFRPDGSHGQGDPQRASWGYRVVRASLSGMSGPSALVGDVNSGQWLRCDIDYVDTRGDETAMEAAHALHRALCRARSELVLRSGELLIIDNVRSVHGRGRFQPSFAGQDRWLKRINVSVRERVE